MKVFYRGQGAWGNSKPAGLTSDPNLLALSGNDWDDYETKTTLNASLYFDGKRLDFDFNIKVLIEGCNYTAKALNEMRKANWDGFFPIPSAHYISLPSDIEFYSILISKLGVDRARTVLELLSDAGLQKNVIQDESFSAVLQSPEFANSLLRESGAVKSFEDGWRVFEGSSIEIQDFELNILSHEKMSKTIPFCFESSILPYDINVLIGPNGIGKSYSIKSLVEYWLKTGIGEPSYLEELGHKPFNKTPNFRNLILVSYSPFEEFEVDLEQSNLQDKQAYVYFGFRYKKQDGNIGISRNLPAYNSAQSIVKAIYDDEKFSFIANRVKKLSTVENAFNSAFSFDSMVLEVKDSSWLGILSLSLTKIDEKQYLLLNADLPKLVSSEVLIAACDLEKGVVFLKDNKLYSLSSGQRLFTYIVINVVGELRENSLVVIDEPELFLHPTLEIEFISLLKAVLKPFKSKAVLATHSLSIVREVPSKCVHIFRDEGHGLDIMPPPFETFGGSVQRISSYVFGDKSVTKPFDNWLKELVEKELAKKNPDIEKLIESLGDEVNEQVMMKILRLGRQANGS
ncbi:AAA family ATPase [Moritella viscosa]|uniref:ATPase AAA-type core domain-containing protein n=1 Tax=Moritella viscosa TaxID=80854 RepID=A0A1L0BJ32_9GAMM|nr:AAA family ATPase [Moritella viscosa]SGZ03448.1 Putative uncharacterized protein [Moritella viscosa]